MTDTKTGGLFDLLTEEGTCLFIMILSFEIVSCTNFLNFSNRARTRDATFRNVTRLLWKKFENRDPTFHHVTHKSLINTYNQLDLSLTIVSFTNLLTFRNPARTPRRNTTFRSQTAHSTRQTQHKQREKSLRCRSRNKSTRLR